MENLKVQNPQLVQKLGSLAKTTMRLHALHRSWQEMNEECVPTARRDRASSTTTTAAHAR